MQIGIICVTLEPTVEIEMARDEGGLACLDGRSTAHNPYGLDQRDLRTAWLYGWTETDRALRTGKLPGERR